MIFAVSSYPQLTANATAFEYDEYGLVNESKGTLYVKQDTGMAWHTKGEIVIIQDKGVWRYQKKLEQAIFYPHVPDMIKAISWLNQSTKNIASRYQIKHQNQCEVLTTYTGDEKIIICYENEHPVSASWEKGSRKFAVSFSSFDINTPVAAKMVIPDFPDNTDIIYQGEM